MIETKNGRLMLSSKCVSNKSRFIKEPEAKGFLRNIGLKIPESEIPMLGGIFFKFIIDIK